MEWTTGVKHWTGLLECHAHKLVAYILGHAHNTKSFQAKDCTKCMSQGSLAA